MSNSTTLAVRQSISAIVAAYQRAVEAVRASSALLKECERQLAIAFATEPDSVKRINVVAGWTKSGRYSLEDAEAIVRQIRVDTWAAIVDRLELKRVMSVVRWEELQRQLSKEPEKLPEITEESVADFAERYLRDLGSLLEESVREVFDWLRPRAENSPNGRYKRNSLWQVGERVVITRVIETATWSDPIVRYDADAELMAMDRVFFGLDGRGVTGESWQSSIKSAIAASKGRPTETEFYELRPCKNGNLHVRFKRMDLVKQLNAIAGGARFPARQRPNPTQAA